MTNDELLARVREDIDNAKANSFDFFGPGGRSVGEWTDEFIAADIIACGGCSAEGVETVEELAAAVAVVRKERAK